MKSRKLITIFLFLALFSFAVFSIYKFFTIRQIVIIGNKNLSEKEVKAGIGIKEGDFLFYPSSKEIYDRLKKIAWIKEAAIRKELSGNLIVYLYESTPVAILEINEKKYLVGEEGSILEEFTDKVKDSPIILPVIKNIDPFKGKEALTESVRLLNFFKSKGLIRSDDEVILTGENPDTLTIKINGFPIIFGKGDYEAKLSKYLLILSETQKRGIKLQYIDLRFPDRVIVKPLE